MARYHCRCARCDARRVLSMKPDEYIRVPKCICGHQRWYLSHWMNKRDTRSMACNCAGYVHVTNRVFPHRKGSKYCWFRKDGSQRMEGDADFKDVRLET
jgi:hypothetical protein